MFTFLLFLLFVIFLLYFGGGKINSQSLWFSRPSERVVVVRGLLVCKICGVLWLLKCRLWYVEGC